MSDSRKKINLDQACKTLEKELGKDGAILIQKFRSELDEILILKEQLKQERKELSEQLEVLDELKLEYTNEIDAHNKEIPRGMFQ